MNAQLIREAQPVVTYRGERWRLVDATRTSDGFLIATGVLLTEEDDTAEGEHGLPILHQFFLGGERS